VNQSASLISQAQDLRDKACRDARQTVAIAYNDLRKLNEQIGYLDRNTIATEKARDAYRQQFDIGQRSLLDVLNAENELYTARRALTNAEHDLALAKARTHAGASTLVSAMGLSRVGGADAAPDLRYWQPGEDGASRCPVTTNELALTSKADLDARARQQLSQSAGAATATAAVAPRPAVQAAPKPAPAETVAAAEPAPATPLSQRLIDWTQAWQGKDVTKYMSMYDPSYKPDNMSRTQWFNNRTRALQKPGPIEVKVENIQRRAISPTMVETQFEQIYTSNNFKDTTKKTLVWKLSNSQWYIVKESNR
jgi:adhesin transport system outer membrane protein